MAPSVLKGGALRWPLQSICRAQAAAQQSDFRIRADAALVLGASVFPHRPCQELQARLDHALQLWRHQCVPVVMVSGGGSGLQDEMMVMTRYLLSCGLPGRCILPCAPGDNTFQSLCSLADLQARYAMRRFLVVSSGYHAARITWIARYLNLDVRVSSPSSSPETLNQATLRRQQLREFIALLAIQLNVAVRSGIARAVGRRPAVAEDLMDLARAPATDRQTMG